MPSGGPRPPRLTSSKTIGYKTLVLEKDPDFSVRSQKVPEYEMSASGRGKGGVAGTRLFEGYYKTRGPYTP